jgi:hypothetical protein
MEWVGTWSGDGMDLWVQAWIDGLVAFLTQAVIAVIIVLVPLVLAASVAVARVRRRFWCRLADRDVEVEFARGFGRRLVGVRSCSAFGDGAPVECRRECLDPAFRQPWALSTRGRSA